MALDEFRLFVRPNVANPAEWLILVAESPIPGIAGREYPCAPSITSAQLDWLRRPNQADLAKLQAIGGDVLRTIMPPQVQALFDYHVSQQVPPNGVRLVVSMRGDAPPGVLGADEVPLEAIFSGSFLATNERTPVSRGISIKPDKDPARVTLPLRILVVVSEPRDMTPVNGAAEKSALQQALFPLVQSGAAEVEFCEGDDATLKRVDGKLRGFHVLHFIGHGDFEIAGADPNPQPHLYFVDGTPHRLRHAAGVEQVFTLLRNANVPLVVMTACSTAATVPNGAKYPGLAFEGLARSVVERQGGPIAVVAMQFDLETTAAEAFTGAFYSRLLNPSFSLDGAVAFARSKMLYAPNPGHRSWVNPTVYWRCKEGRVFEFSNVRGALSEAQRTELTRIEVFREAYEQVLVELAQQPSDIAAAEPTAQRWRAKILALLDERGRVLGDVVRLRGGVARADGEIECALTMQIRTPVKIGQLQVEVRFEATEFVYARHAAVPGGPQLVVNPTATGAFVVVPDASMTATWEAGEHQLGTICFRRLPDPSKPFSYLRLQNARAQFDGQAAEPFPTLEAIVFGP